MFPLVPQKPVYFEKEEESRACEGGGSHMKFFFHMQNMHATLRRVSKYCSQSRQAGRQARQYDAWCVQIKRESCQNTVLKKFADVGKKAALHAVWQYNKTTEVYKAHVPQCHLQAFHSQVSNLNDLHQWCLVFFFFFKP